MKANIVNEWHSAKLRTRSYVSPWGVVVACMGPHGDSKDLNRMIRMIQFLLRRNSLGLVDGLNTLTCSIPSVFWPQAHSIGTKYLGSQISTIVLNIIVKRHTHTITVEAIEGL